jgi:hypothetical protein
MSLRGIQIVLKTAALYNIVWGTIAILFPFESFEILEMVPPRYPQLWQCIGMIVGVYGVGYWLASVNPMTLWPIVLVGFMGKVLGPLGFLAALVENELPLQFGIHIILNDLIWWIPFFLILKRVFQNKLSIRLLSPF